jgi:acetyl-CoA C-acetyltransferase
MPFHDRKVAIIGSGRTKFGELFDRSFISLVAEAGVAALRNAGISREELDEMMIGTFVPEILNDQGNFSAFLSEEMGFDLPITRVEAACASGGTAIYNGMRAIKSGDCDLVLVGGAEKATDRSARKAYMAAASEWERLYDFDFVSLNAVLTQRFLHENPDVKPEDMALVSVKNHRHARDNPHAHFRNQLTVERVLDSPVISEPVRLLDCSPVSDGAAAVILASEEKARELSDEPVFLTGYGMSTDSIGLYARESLSNLRATRRAGEIAFRRAGLALKDVDLFEMHDAYIIQEVMGYEDLGLEERGKGPDLMKRAFESDSGGYHLVHERKDHTFITNAGGGLKADGHPVGATGVRQVGEVYNQITGISPYPVEKSLGRRPEVGLMHNIGGSGSHITVLLMETESHINEGGYC